MKRAVLYSDLPLIRDVVLTGMRERSAFDEVQLVTDPQMLHSALEKFQVDLLVLAVADMAHAVRLVNRCNGEMRGIRTVMVVPDASPEVTYLAFMAGASDLVSCRSDLNQLLDHIVQISEGKTVFRSSQLQMMESELKRDGILSLIQAKQIDREILAGVCEGLTDKEIAERVFLSPQTVRNKISSLLQRSGKSNRTQLALSYAPISEILKPSA